MGGLGLLRRFLETEGAVEPGRGSSHGAQPHPGESAAGMVHEGLHQGPPHTGASRLRDDVDMTDPADFRIVEVGVAVQTTNSHQLGTEPDPTRHLSDAIEAIRAVPPVVDETLHQVVPFRLAQIDEIRDAIGQLIERLHIESCDHVAMI